MKERNLDLQPVTGAEVRKLIDTTLSATPDTIRRVREAMGLN